MTIVKTPKISRNFKSPTLLYNSPVLSLNLQQTTYWGLSYISANSQKTTKIFVLYSSFLIPCLCLSHQYPETLYTCKPSGHSSLKIKQVIFTILSKPVPQFHVQPSSRQPTVACLPFLPPFLRGCTKPRGRLRFPRVPSHSSPIFQPIPTLSCHLLLSKTHIIPGTRGHTWHGNIPYQATQSYHNDLRFKDGKRRQRMEYSTNQ